MFNKHLIYMVLCAVFYLSNSALAAISESQKAIPPATPSYVIGPGDGLSIFVWANPEVSTNVTVRPDGLITTPLVEDLKASGLTPTQLARSIESRLSKFIKNPKATVTVTNFVGRYTEQIRVVGEAAQPKSIPFKENMTVLDVVIAVGGLTTYAAGNRATLVRTVNGKKIKINVRLDDLVRDGDIEANVKVKAGDVLIIPESWF